MKRPTKTDKRVRVLKERLEHATTQRDHRMADAILGELETLEADNPRWSHLRGDALSRRKKKKEAVESYARAVALYAHRGFLPRAVAMAKVAIELDPNRVDLLTKLDPSAARELHRKLRPRAVRAGQRGTTQPLDAAAAGLDPAPDASPTEVRFSNAPPRQQTLDLELSDIEFAERAAPPSLPAEVAATLDTHEQEEAERQACLPLLPLFAEAPRAALVHLVTESQLIRCVAGETLIRRGDDADALYGLIEGTVRVHIPGLSAEAEPRLGPGDVFGEACLLGRSPRRADVSAEGDVTALRIPKNTLSYLVRAHEGLADVLFEMMTRRLLANLLHTSRLFAELTPSQRREVAAEFELRRARVGTQLLRRGKRSDGLYVTLTGHIDVSGSTDASGSNESPPISQGAGVMFGHASMLEDAASEVNVRARETLLVLRLPREAFARIAMQYPPILMRVSELAPVARVSA